MTSRLYPKCTMFVKSLIRNPTTAEIRQKSQISKSLRGLHLGIAVNELK